MAIGSCCLLYLGGIGDVLMPDVMIIILPEAIYVVAEGHGTRLKIRRASRMLL